MLSIYLQDDSVSTGEKISVGDAKDKVMSTYGAPADESEIWQCRGSGRNFFMLQPCKTGAKML